MKSILTILTIALFIPAVALAHAFLDRASPKVGSTVDQSPEAVKIWFTQELEKSFSAIQVFSSDGKEIDRKDSHLDDKDAKLLIVSVPQLPSGTYKVSWHVVSKDTHKTQGDFKFTVK